MDGYTYTYLEMKNLNFEIRNNMSHKGKRKGKAIPLTGCEVP
jgi:hypothetical protein